jgi:hypothetical protein
VVVVLGDPTMAALRRSAQVAFLALLLLAVIASSSVSTSLALQWGTVMIFFGMLLLADLLFINDNAFVFDPFYASYAKLIDPNY